MNVEEVARCYQVTTTEVFIALDIDPVPGDEKLSLKDLGNKYHKTGPEMENAFNRLNNIAPNQWKKP